MAISSASRVARLQTDVPGLRTRHSLGLSGQPQGDSVIVTVGAILSVCLAIHLVPRLSSRRQGAVALDAAELSRPSTSI
jgi:hypothetical protein